MNVLDLFSGIGGFSLGLRMASPVFRTVQFCEINRNCWPTLERHFPGVPIHDDIRTLNFDKPVDMVVGGFPCQDISVAGKGAGIDGERSGLWSEMLRIVRVVRPSWVVPENVPALRTRGADRVIADLEAEGYAVWPLVVGADDVGAPHRRKRVWIVAFSEGVGRTCEGVNDGRLADGAGAAVAHTERARRVTWSGVERDEEGAGSGRDQPCDSGAELAHADSCRGGQDFVLPQLRPDRPVESSGDSRLRSAEAQAAQVARWPARPGEPQHEWEAPRVVHAERVGLRVCGRAEDAGSPGEVQGGQEERQRLRPHSPAANGDRGLAATARLPEPRVGGATDGLPPRLVRAWNREALAAYGNSVVPQVVAAIGRAILTADTQRRN